MKKIKWTSDEWGPLSVRAWSVRESAHAPVTGTKVGCSLLTVRGKYAEGCNVEHPFLSVTIHAEANALGSMIAMFGPRAQAGRILVVAKRHKFTPCGQCMDMIMQLSSQNCFVGYQNERQGDIYVARAEAYMPEYPC